MDRYLVVSSDCHAGLPPEQYRDYLDPQYRDAFDAALPIQIEMTTKMSKKFLVEDINQEWRKGNEAALNNLSHATAMLETTNQINPNVYKAVEAHLGHIG